jgi:hypothetical protein
MKMYIIPQHRDVLLPSASLAFFQEQTRWVDDVMNQRDLYVYG